MNERAGGNGTTPETHPELYVTSGLGHSKAKKKAIREVVDLKAAKLQLTVERVQALLKEWEQCLKDRYGIWDRATKVRELRAALKGGGHE